MLDFQNFKLPKFQTRRILDSQNFRLPKFQSLGIVESCRMNFFFFVNLLGVPDSSLPIDLKTLCFPPPSGFTLTINEVENVDYGTDQVTEVPRLKFYPTRASSTQHYDL